MRQSGEAQSWRWLGGTSTDLAHERREQMCASSTGFPAHMLAHVGVLLPPCSRFSATRLNNRVPSPVICPVAR